MDCLLRVNAYVTGISALWFGPDIVVAYAIAYLSSQRIRNFASQNAGSITENLQVNAVASITVVTLIIAAVTILATLGEAHPSDQREGPIHTGFEWLASASLFAIGQLLLTRQVTVWTSYFAVAFTDSLWWCLSWSLWVIFAAMVPGAAWIIILAIAPIGVVLATAFNLASMRRAS